MSACFEISIRNEAFLLLPQKAIYRPSRSQLIIADLHLGKSSHFRKHGMVLPEESVFRDTDTLHFLIAKWNPAEVIFLGDLFHSDYNSEWKMFKSFLTYHPAQQFILIEGNHDILDEEHYRLPNLFVAGSWEDEQFLFTHQPADTLKFNFCGHVHPGVQLQGKARQSEKLPCFLMTENQMILPAFGYFTGLYILELKETAHYFLIAGSKIYPYRKPLSET